MPLLGLVVGLEQHDESLLIEKVHLFSNFIATSNYFIVLLTITSLDVTCYNLATCIQDTNSYRDGNSPVGVGQSLVLVQTWHAFSPPSFDFITCVICWLPLLTKHHHILTLKPPTSQT